MTILTLVLGINQNFVLRWLQDKIFWNLINANGNTLFWLVKPCLGDFNGTKENPPENVSLTRIKHALCGFCLNWVYTKWSNHRKSWKMRGKKRKFCRNLTTLLYRQNLRYNYQKYLTSWQLNLIKYVLSFQKKYTKKKPKRGKYMRLTCKPRIYRWHTLQQPSSHQFSYKSEKWVLFDVVYRRMKLVTKQTTSEKYCGPIHKIKDCRWEKIFHVLKTAYVFS